MKTSKPRISSLFLLVGGTILLCSLHSVAMVKADRVVAAWIPSGPSRLNRSQSCTHRAFLSQPVLLPSRKTVAVSVSDSENENAEWSVPESPPTTGSPTDPKKHSSRISSNHKHHYYYMHPKKHPPEATAGQHLPSKTPPPVNVDPTVLEESLLSQHADIESLLLKTTSEQDAGLEIPNVSPNETAGRTNNNNNKAITAISAKRAVPYFLDPAAQLFQSTSNAIDRLESSKEDFDSNRSISPEENNGNKIDSPTEENLRLAAPIDRAIYQFNTNLVNILYKFISILYPTSLELQSRNTTPDTTPLLSPLLGTEYNQVVTGDEKVLRFEKFYLFETVARIPYFAYLSVLHLRESLGDRGILFETTPNKGANEKRIETMRIHYAQADNELHHLLIMEALGGNSRAVDRFFAHALAFAYYWFVVLVFLWNEKAAYHLNEIIEDHAFNTYDEFLAIHKSELKALPVPDVARKYYETDYRKNPHLFEAFCAVSKTPRTHSTMNDEIVNPRGDNRPHELSSLYDVFMNIRDDEREHWMSLCNIVQYGEMDAVDEVNVKSTNGERRHSDGE